MEYIGRKPTNIMGVSLLHKCNFNCEHCGYIYVGEAEDHIIKPGYKLSWSQLINALDDCKSIPGSYWNMNYTGGEPTLWEDQGKTLVDVLIQTALAGQSPSYNTNGSWFDDYSRTYDFFFRYMEATTVPLMTFISMDKFHKNYDGLTGRAKSLDNIVKVMDEIPEEWKSQFRTHVIIIITKEPDSTLSAEMKAHYGASGITFGDFPLMRIGKAKKLVDQVPEMIEYFPPNQNESGGPRVLVLVGDDYYIGSERKGRLGRLKDLYTF
ncbi:MAG: radical SAM protein [Deltaproteobacteria bacterium]|nr:radical SAM protein [Deltaproteobacteria bacterium]